MNNKIALIYDGKTYQVVVNEQVISNVEKIEEAYKCFEKTIYNNQSIAEGSWETIRDQAKKLGLDSVEIFDNYQAIQYKTVKYFHNTGKLFYIDQGEMFPLMGGYRLLLFLLERMANKQLSESDELIELCVEAIKKGIVYRIKESSFILSSPIFNYGNVTYNFLTQEMHKGTHTEQDSFEIFKQYVLEVIK